MFSLTNAPGADLDLLWQADLTKVRAQLAAEQSSLRDSSAERESLAQQLEKVSQVLALVPNTCIAIL